MPAINDNAQFAAQLKNETAGVKLNLKVFGVKRTLDDGQTNAAAAVFHAAGDTVTARKKIINTRNGAYKEVLAVISRARRFWRTLTVDYHIDGIRLLRRELLPVFIQEMEKIKSDLAVALSTLDAEYATLQAEAKARLGDLYNAADYPASLTEFFSIDWEFPSIEPPDYLKQLNPALYEQEQARVAARLDEAIKTAEQAFTIELKAMVDLLLDKLTGLNDDGKPKMFRDTAITNLRQFFERFNQLKVGNNADLNAVVEMAENMLGGVDPAELRKEAGLKANVAKGLGGVAAALEKLIVNKPTRAIDLSDEDGEPAPAAPEPAAATAA